MKKISVLLFLIIFSVSCSTNKKTTSLVDQEGSDQDKHELVLELNGDSDSSRAGRLQTIHFDYNSAQLSEAAKRTLNENIIFIIANPAIEIQIEGHTDERGSAQFNLSLGEKRAKSVMLYMQARGIDHSRLAVISLGKERPVDLSHAEEAWSKNRRANFVVTRK